MTQPKTQMMAGETMARDGAANLYRGAEAVGGHLFLTSSRLIFESHAFNVQTGVSIFDRASIVGVEPRVKKLFGFIPINNHLAVKTADGQEAVFVLNDRDGWLAALGAR